jgi:cytokinin dehydrogenase
MITCSREKNSDLFYASLGGLGQFGVIIRARIPLEPAQKRARWIRLFYTDVIQFMTDEEKLISTEKYRVDYLEGEVIFTTTQVSFILPGYNFSDSDQQKINQLSTQTNGPVYLLEALIYYNDTTAASMEQVINYLKLLTIIVVSSNFCWHCSRHSFFSFYI